MFRTLVIVRRHAAKVKRIDFALTLVIVGEFWPALDSSVPERFPPRTGYRQRGTITQ